MNKERLSHDQEASLAWQAVAKRKYPKTDIEMFDLETNNEKILEEMKNNPNNEVNLLVGVFSPTKSKT